MQASPLPPSRRRWAQRLPGRQTSGVALIIVLAMLVMVLVVVLAFFSRAAQQRHVSSASIAVFQADQLASAATALVLDDLRHEIEAGSVADPLSGAVREVYRPILVDNLPGVAFPAAPSLQPQKAPADLPGPLLKVSRSELPFFEKRDGYREVTGREVQGAARASEIATSAPALDGRRILAGRWLLPHFLTEAEAGVFTVPDWIYLDREGRTPTAFTVDDLARYRDQKPDNQEYIIGRFAYAIYDEGSLIDINLAGNSLPGEKNRDRGRLHQIPLGAGTEPPKLSSVSDFLAWRDAGEPLDPEAGGGLFDPRRTFLSVPSGSQAFLGRQELIRYTAQENSPISPDALPYLTTFSREINAPHYEPDLPASTPSDLEAGEFNPALAAIRFPSETTLQRPEGAITLPAGTPVVARRFPLGKLALLSETSADADAIRYYFGLERDGHGWRYTATTEDGRIARLSEIPALGREPNFIELLQATLFTGSLGRSAGNTYTFDHERDEKRNLHVLQIAANLIDQWDADDFPTTLRFPSGNTGEWLELYGVENLPYLNNIQMIAHRPEHDRNRFQIWTWFDVWNPHQNAKTAPTGVEAFRIQPRSGKSYAVANYYVWMPNPSGSGGANYTYGNGSLFGGYTGSPQDVLSVNAAAMEGAAGGGVSWRWFPGTGDYSEPVILGSRNAPQSASDYPTMLLVDYAHIPPAVSDPEETGGIRVGPNGQSVQPYIDDLVERYHPKPTDEKSNDHWEALFDGEDHFIGYRARYGVKSQNAVRIMPVPGEEVVLDLQALINGEWRTYQVFDGFLPTTNGYGVSLGVGAGVLTDVREDAPASFRVDTHFSRASDRPEILDSRFYRWGARDTMLNLWKADPRTTRFGHADAVVLQLGRTIRTNASAFTPTPTESDVYLLNDWGFIHGLRLPQDLSVFERKPRRGAGAAQAIYFWPFGLVGNIPEGSIDPNNPTHSYNPTRYRDRDGVIRPGDGYIGAADNTGALPTVPGRLEDRPVILNRPFRNVGEMGYAFRDLPWKTIDFFSRQSGDLGLLDVFSIEEPTGAVPLVAGKVNLNSSRPEVLALLLKGSGNAPEGLTEVDDPGVLSEEQALELAEAIVAESRKAPFRHGGDLVRRVLAPASSTSKAISATAKWQPYLKTAREAPIRTLAGLGATRTWNLLVDLICQSGRFTPSSRTGADFMVRGERRVWVHLAVDRLTGEVVDSQVEVVRE